MYLTRKRSNVCAVMALAVFLAACAKNPATVIDLPNGVSQREVGAWTSATAQLKTISDASHAGVTAAITLNRAGTLKDGAAYQDILRGLGRITQAEISANGVLQKAPEQFGQPIQAQVFGFSDAILTEVGKLNANGLPAQVQTFVNTIKLAATTILALKGSL